MASRVALAACWIAGITALTAMLATPRTPQRIVFTGTLLSVVSSGPPGSLGSETQAGVERVAQAVAQEIDGEDGQHDGDAGEEATHQACSRNSRPSASMFPHSGVGGRIPRPRKLSADPVMIAAAIPSVARTV